MNHNGLRSHLMRPKLQIWLLTAKARFAVTVINVAFVVDKVTLGETSV
jgi:hypothetical protein